VSCFSLGFLEQLLIALVIIIVIVAIVQRLLPMALAPFPVVLEILRWILYGVIAIAAIILLFDLFACLLGSVRVGRVLP
jgi:hypothetical protein